MEAQLELPKLYICPDEVHPITRAIHLSRLAAFYPKCRTCPLRTDTGQLPLQTVQQVQTTERRVKRPTLLTVEGIRGTYLNEIGRKHAREIGEAVAGLLWREAPLVATSRENQLVGRARPTIVVAHDERPSSPDIVTGVVSSLRRMGCHVIDIGLATRPTFWFAVQHLAAPAGLLVTGAGGNLATTGFDLCGRGASPWSNLPDGPLSMVEAQLGKPISRATRQAGNVRLFNAMIPYEAGLWKHFHALRPLNVVVGTSSQLMAELLQRVFAKLPCQVRIQMLPVRSRNVHDPDDADVIRVASKIAIESFDFGLVIDDDCQRCGLLDDNGQLVPIPQLLQLVLDSVLSHEPFTSIVMAEPHPDATSSTRLNAVDLRRHQGLKDRSNLRVFPSGPTFADMHQEMTKREASVGLSGNQQIWLRDGAVTSDALLLLAKLLESASLTDAPFSSRCRS